MGLFTIHTFLLILFASGTNAPRGMLGSSASEMRVSRQKWGGEDGGGAIYQIGLNPGKISIKAQHKIQPTANTVCASMNLNIRGEARHSGNAFFSLLPAHRREIDLKNINNGKRQWGPRNMRGIPQCAMRLGLCNINGGYYNIILPCIPNRIRYRTTPTARRP